MLNTFAVQRQVEQEKDNSPRKSGVPAMAQQRAYAPELIPQRMAEQKNRGTLERQVARPQLQEEQQQQLRMSVQMGGEIIPMQMGANDPHVRQFQDRSEPKVQMGGNDVAASQPDYSVSRTRPARRAEQQQQPQRYRVVQYG